MYFLDAVVVWLLIGLLIYLGYWFYLHWDETLDEVWTNFKESMLIHPRTRYSFIFTIMLCMLAGPFALGLIWLKRKKDQERMDRDI